MLLVGPHFISLKTKINPTTKLYRLRCGSSHSELLVIEPINSLGSDWNSIT